MEATAEICSITSLGHRSSLEDCHAVPHKPMAVQSCATRKSYFYSGLIIFAVRHLVVRFRRGSRAILADNAPNLSASALKVLRFHCEGRGGSFSLSAGYPRIKVANLSRCKIGRE